MRRVRIVSLAIVVVVTAWTVTACKSGGAQPKPAPPVYDIRDHTEVVHDIYRKLLGRSRASVGAAAPARNKVHSD